MKPLELFIPPMRHRPNQEKGPGFWVRAMHKFSAEKPGDLTFEQGDVMKIAEGRIEDFPQNSGYSANCTEQVATFQLIFVEACVDGFF